MVASAAGTVEEYLKALPADRRAIVAAVRKAVNANLPAGYYEAMAYGMIGWSVPVNRLPETYNGQPLMYAALAAQKNYYALYVMCASDPRLLGELRTGFTQAGKKLDMGKSCIRFRSLDELPLPVIERVIAAVPVDKYVAIYLASREMTAAGKRAKAARKR